MPPSGPHHRPETSGQASLVTAPLTKRPPPTPDDVLTAPAHQQNTVGIATAADIVPFPQSSICKLRNGSWAGSPIHLSIFGLSNFHRNTAVKQVNTRLRKLAPGATTYEDLKVSAGNVNADGFAEIARVSWMPRAWYRDVDLVAEMDRVRQFLNASDPNITACWASSAGNDRRTVGQFDFVQSSSTATLSAAEAAECVRRFCEQNGHDLRRVTAFGFGKDQNAAGISGVSVTMRRPESMKELEGLVTREMQKGDGTSFGGFPCKVLFRCSRSVIPVAFPTTIVGLNRSDIEHDDLLIELQYMVDQFNLLHGAEESLLPVSQGRFFDTVDGHVIAIPSCVGLAEFVCKQPVISGPQYELAYQLNGNGLKTADAVAATEARAVPLMLEQLQADVRRHAEEAAGLRSDMTRAVKEMTALNANFATFGGDLVTNLGRLFSQLKQASDIGAEVLTEDVRSLTHELELRLVKMNTELVDCQIKLLQTERHVQQVEKDAPGAVEEGEAATSSSAAEPESNVVLNKMLGEGGFSGNTAATENTHSEQQAREALATMSQAAKTAEPQVPTTPSNSFDRDTELRMLLAQRKKLVEKEKIAIQHLNASQQQILLLSKQRNRATILRDSTGLGIMAKVKDISAPEPPTATRNAAEALVAAPASAPASIPSGPALGAAAKATCPTAPKGKSGPSRPSAEHAINEATGHSAQNQGGPSTRAKTAQDRAVARAGPTPPPAAQAKRARQH